MNKSIKNIRENQEMFMGLMSAMQEICEPYLITDEQKRILENAKWDISSCFDIEAITIINNKFHAY